MRFSHRALVGLLGLALVATAACSGDDGGDNDGDGDGAGETSGGSDGGAGLESIAAGLAMLPETGEPHEIVAWGDLARAAEIAGVAPPDDPADSDAVREYVSAVTGGPVEGGQSSPVTAIPPTPAQFQRVADQTEFADDVGWTILEVDRFVERQIAPGLVTVMEGSFDESALSDALGEPEDGIWVAGSGEDMATDFNDISPARPMGESLWLGLDGDQLTITRSSEHAAAARRAAAGERNTPTFADDEALAGLAEALDAESPYAAMLVRPGLMARTELPATPEEMATRCDEALPAPTSAVATAVADDDGPVIVLGLAHASPDAASANAEALESLVEDGSSLANNQPWNELVSLEGVSVTGDDLVVVARLRPSDPARSALWHRLLVARDSLVSSC